MKHKKRSHSPLWRIDVKYSHVMFLFVFLGAKTIILKICMLFLQKKKCAKGLQLSFLYIVVYKNFHTSNNRKMYFSKRIYMCICCVYVYVFIVQVCLYTVKIELFT